MFQLLKDPNFDFMRHGKMLLGISTVVVLAFAVLLAVHGLNLGIEFTGGTELYLKYASTPDVGSIRGQLAAEGIESQVVTTIGDPADNEIYIKLGQQGEEEAGAEDLTSVVTDTLRGGAAADTAHDLNVMDAVSLGKLLSDSGGPLLGGQAETVAGSILAQRKEKAIFESVDELAGVEGVDAAVLDYLKANAKVGPLALRSQSYIGPAIGEELMRNALLAVFGSLIGMLIYIWIRFQLEWGFAAVLALTHDTLITLGLFSLFDKQMSLPVVAAFLTLVGYSVNDTVVVFDRIRENLRNRAGSDLRATINLSINQTLSRTVITSGLTFIVVFGLLLFGGAALNAFSFVLSVGVVVGTYSSIFIASPILIVWRELRGRDRAAATSTAGADAPSRRARKVRSS